MAADSESTSPTSTPEGLSTQPRLWSRVCRWATWGIFGAIGLFALSQPFLWYVLESPIGDSLPTMITESMVIVSIVLTLVWVGCFSQWQGLTKAVVLVPALALIGGFLGSIRNLDLNGDIGINFEFKWEPTQAERIAAHQAQQATLSAVAPVAELPLVTPEDMPAYRGVHRDGVVIGPEIRTSWVSPPKPLWQQPCGGGYASMVIVGDRLVTIEQREDNEAVICYQASTGRELWTHQYPARFWEAMGGPGPRSTPTIDGDLVFAQGALGELVCLELATGKVRWSKNLLTLFKLPNAEWGLTSSPLIVDHRVVANAGGRRGDGLVAFDRSSGELLWAGAGLVPGAVSAAPTADETSTPPPVDEAGHVTVSESQRNRPGYSSPTLVTIQGQRQILNFDGTGLWGCDPETGQSLWFYPHENGPAVNAAQPILFDEGRVFISCSYDVGCAMVQVTQEAEKWGVKKLWANMNMRCKFSSPVLHEGFIYGLDEGILVCLDPQTGDRRWKKGRYNHGQLLLTNGILVVLTEDGRCVFVKPNPEQHEELGQFPALSDDFKTWNPPALVRGKLYVRNHHDMACYDLK